MKYGISAGVLKPLDEITLPDPRIQVEPYRLEPDRTLSVSDIRERLENYSSLHANVPERVRTQFDVARNLMLYSYFVFEFQTQAELQAYAALEFALREKLGKPTKTVKRGKTTKETPLMLGELLHKSIERQLIQPKQLPSFSWDNESDVTRLFWTV